MGQGSKEDIEWKYVIFFILINLINLEISACFIEIYCLLYSIWLKWIMRTKAKVKTESLRRASKDSDINFRVPNQDKFSHLGEVSGEQKQKQRIKGVTKNKNQISIISRSLSPIHHISNLFNPAGINKDTSFWCRRLSQSVLLHWMSKLLLYSHALFYSSYKEKLSFLLQVFFFAK